jgi:hypothetical protein
MGIMIIFSVIWTGLRKSLNKFSINYDYAKDMNLVSKFFQIAIKLAISTAVCNTDLQNPRMIWYNVIVEEVFVYRHVNACTYMFVYILHTFVKLQVFLSLCWSNWRAKSVSISNITQSISLSSNNMCTTVEYCISYKKVFYWINQ